MYFVELKTFENVLDAFNDVKSVFPVLSKRPDIKDYLRKIHQFGKAYAIRDDNQYCAFCGIYMNDFSTKIAYITLIGVCKEYRKHHLGTKLIGFCENEAQKAGMDYVRLEVEKNNSAMNFYEKNGYKLEKNLEKTNYMIKNLKR